MKFRKFTLDMGDSSGDEDETHNNGTPPYDKDRRAEVIHIKNGKGKLPLEAFVVNLTQWNQHRAMTNPILIKGQSKTKTDYIDEINCVHRMVTIIDHDGTELGNRSKNGGFYSRKCLVFSFTQEFMTEEKIREFVNGTLFEAVWKYRHANKSLNLDTKKEHGPHMRADQDYRIVDHWDDIIFAELHWQSKKPQGNIESVLSQVVGGTKRLQKWLKIDPENHLYSVFGKGKVPIEFLLEYKDTGIDAILDHADKKRLLEREQEDKAKEEAAQTTHES